MLVVISFKQKNGQLSEHFFRLLVVGVQRF